MADRGKIRIPIVAMTAIALAEDGQTAWDAGMNGHIAKRLDIFVMVAMLQKVLGGA